VLIAQLINGLTQGSIYALIAIGFVIIFGTMNLVTFAHGEVYMIGAFMDTSPHDPAPSLVCRPDPGRRCLDLRFHRENASALVPGHMPPPDHHYCIILKDLAVIFSARKPLSLPFTARRSRLGKSRFRSSSF
jgi:hypothetical protein